MPTVTYPLDVTGINVANKITSEPFTLQTPALGMSAFIVPGYQPFNGDPNYVQIVMGGTTLTYGVDYTFRHQFKYAYEQLGLRFYGSIEFLNRTLTGPGTITYNTLGGLFAQNTRQAILDATKTLLALRTVYWDQINGVPIALPPTNHTHPAEDLKGWDDLITAVTDLTAAVSNTGPISSLLATVNASLTAHLAAANPHAMNATKVGLGNVNNAGFATGAQSVDKTNNSVYATPAAVWAMISATFPDLFNDMAANLSFDSTSVGLELVENAGVATYLEAFAGTAEKYIMANQAKGAVFGAMKARTVDTGNAGTYINPVLYMAGSHPQAPATGNDWLVINTYSGAAGNGTLVDAGMQIALPIAQNTSADAVNVAGVQFRRLFGGAAGSWTKLSAFDGSSYATQTWVGANYVGKTGNQTMAGTLTAADFIQSSDRRKKDGLKVIKNARELLKKMKGYTGHYIDDKDKRERLFLIAQEVWDGAPQAVYKDEEDMLAVSYTMMVPLLVEALNETTDYLESEIKDIWETLNSHSRRLSYVE